METEKDQSSYRGDVNMDVLDDHHGYAHLPVALVVIRPKLSSASMVSSFQNPDSEKD